MIKPVKIQDKIIYESFLSLLISEMACPHQGNVQNAYDLVKVAAEIYVDAIQLQISKKESREKSQKKK